SALCIASFGGHFQMVKLLVERGAIKARRQCSALRLASHQGYTQIVQFLLENGADGEGPVQDGHTALQDTIANRYTEIVHLLVAKGVNINAEALYIASEMGQQDIVCLLDNGADVNAASGEYGSALQVVAKKGLTELVHLLIKHGANVNSVAGKHGPALYLASRDGHTGYWTNRQSRVSPDFFFCGNNFFSIYRIFWRNGKIT
ncbi:ankyrin repeat domain-containing protein, partial [Mycena olivaceomarginata]